MEHPPAHSEITQLLAEAADFRLQAALERARMEELANKLDRTWTSTDLLWLLGTALSVVGILTAIGFYNEQARYRERQLKWKQRVAGEDICEVDAEGIYDISK